MLKDKSYGKINLALDITKTNNDGYHELKMINLPIEFHDTLSMMVSREYHLFSNVDLPENNTIYQSIEVMRKHYGFKDNFTIVLEKRIPSEAGLAGGSGNGALVMRMLRDRYRLKVSDDELMRIGLEVGADVPYCIKNVPSIVEGIGDKITPIELNDDLYVLLVKSNLGVSTKLCYQKYDEIGGDHPNIDLLVEALKNKNENDLERYMGNSLERAAFNLNHQIEPIIKELKELGIGCSGMSGSGSCVFGISFDKEKIEYAKDILKNRYYFVKETKIKR